MSLIDDVISRRFSRAKDFKKGENTGTFKKELKKAVIESPGLGSLRDNVEGLHKVVEDYGKYVRQDKVTDSMTREMLKKFKQENPNATKQDVKSAKAIFKHLSKSGAPKPTEMKKSSVNTKANIRAAKVASKRAELNRGPRRELPEFLKNRGTTSISGNKQAPNSSVGSGGGISAGQGGGSLAGGSVSPRPRLKF